MDIEKIEEIAEAEMASRQDLRFREPGWILYHGKRTGRIAQHLAERLDLDVDSDAVYVAGLFHDIGKGEDSHNEVGATYTRELLTDLVPEATLHIICDAVSSHNQRKKSDGFSDCAKLVQDADLIDHVGPIDVWMAFYWSGTHGESIHDHIAFCKGDDCKKFQNYMRSHLNFGVSRQMLEERIEASEKFFSEFHRTYFEGI
jgi:uncharacterized protein